ncbi:MAG: Single-stranded-DNA-specific exonuclease RecJ [Flavobacteriales bacterium]|nr:MAG: Single-stranded-DNA-specific exonuclease RecJ [Flavobacteriales bacterium]
MNNWIKLEQPTVTEVNSLQADLKIPHFICSLLLQRGINSLDKAKFFFRPELDSLHDPYIMKDMEKAIVRINNASSEKIMILGDYDVDGTTSTSMLYTYFSYRNYDLLYYIPDRYKEGYGVSTESIDYAKDNNIKLIITVDCGIKAVNQVEYANSKGIDIIICDHHLPDTKVPNAYAILNPKQLDCSYPFKDLCGCGIAYKLITAHNLKSENKLNIRSLLDFVALATVSDMMPLIDENRVMIFHGLKEINNNPRLGLRNFLKSNNNQVDESNISFNIGPRINAAGRMKNGKIIVDLLVEEDANKVMSLSNEVEFLNSKRRTIEKDVFEDVAEKIDQSKYSNIFYGQNWSTGVLGIVASRVIEKSYKPTIILTDFNENLLTGSVRSVSGFNVHDALVKCEKYLHQFGGHKFAAGLKIEKSKLDLFSQNFEKVVKESVAGIMFEKNYKYDIEISFSEITIHNLKILSRMAPFGLENRRPVFRTNNCTITEDLKFIGKESQIVKSKIQDSLLNKLPFICFDKKDELVNLKSKFDILYTVGINKYSGKEEIEIILKQICVK